MLFKQLRIACILNVYIESVAQRAVHDLPERRHVEDSIVFTLTIRRLCN